MFLIINCSTKPYWVRNNQNLIIQEKNDFPILIFYFEPDSNYDSVKNLTISIFNFIDILKTYPYLNIKNSTYKIVVYKDYESYKMYKPFKIDSLGHFDRNEKLIHVPLYLSPDKKSYILPDYIIYHELIHAILEECCSNYPLWLNEGLALLLQNIQKPFICNSNSIYFPDIFLVNLNFTSLSQLHLPYYPDFKNIYDIYQQNLISGLFVYYLFNTNQLMNYIQMINKHPDQDIFNIITKGNLKLYSEQKIKFYEWILSVESNVFLNGC